MANSNEKRTFTDEEKKEYSNKKRQTAYDKQKRVKQLIIDDYKKQHPTSHKLPPDGLIRCGDPLPLDYQGLYVLQLNENGNEYHNHTTCKSWACPVCANKRALARAKEIEAALIAANEKGLKQLFITFTIPHKKRHKSAYVISKLYACYNSFLQSRYTRKLKDEFGFFGQIKCLDYTISENGLHAHLHCIFMFDTTIDGKSLNKAISRLFLQQWAKVVKRKLGREINKKHGFHCEYMELGEPGSTDAKRIAQYAAKSISIYLSSPNDKQHKKTSRSPFELVSKYATSDDLEMFLDFYKGQCRRRHIVFSSGLKEKLEIEAEEMDAPASAMIAEVKGEHLEYLRDERHRHLFENMASGSVENALVWLNEQTIKEQQKLAARYQDYAYRNFDLTINKFSEIIRDLDTPQRNLKDTIKRHAEEQKDAAKYIEKVEILKQELEMENIYKKVELKLKKQAEKRAAKCAANPNIKREGWRFFVDDVNPQRPLSGIQKALGLEFFQNTEKEPVIIPVFEEKPRLVHICGVDDYLDDSDYWF